MKTLSDLVKHILEEDYQFLSSVDSVKLYPDPITGSTPVNTITCRPVHFKGDAFRVDFIIVQFEPTKFLLTGKNQRDEVLGCVVFKSDSDKKNLHTEVRAFIEQVLTKHQNDSYSESRSGSTEGSELNKKDISSNVETLKRSVSSSSNVGERSVIGDGSTISSSVNDMPGFEDEYEIGGKLGGVRALGTDFGPGKKAEPLHQYGQDDLYPLGVKNIYNEKLSDPLRLPDLGANPHNTDLPPLSGSGGSGGGGMVYDPLRELDKKQEQEGRPNGAKYPGIKYDDPFGHGSAGVSNPHGSFNMFGNGFM
ncbi:hypothetical protein ACO0QE_000824 [Hanseniaspora vineae]